MKDNASITEKILDIIPAAAGDFLKTAAATAAAAGQELYAIGGIVRGGLTGRTASDLDLAVDRDAIALAEKLAAPAGGKLTRHPRFGTATIVFRDFHADFATLRRETYPQPGELPSVAPGTLADDLGRRDFTINAMACRLAPEPAGELNDLYGGQADIKAGLIRILHPKSFVDDPTRIWRALRYEQRLGFSLEAETEKLLRQYAPRLAGISGERLRYELECVCREERPEDIFRRAAATGVLACLPELKTNDEILSRFAEARMLCQPKQPPLAVCLSLLTNGDAAAVERLISRLGLPRKDARVLQQTAVLTVQADKLAAATVPSTVVAILQGNEANTLYAFMAASRSPAVKSHIENYLAKYRYVRPLLGGDDLLALGVPSGPVIRNILHELRAARLDGLTRTRQDETKLVKKLLKQGKQ